MKTLGIIPARGGSKRLPRKNLRLLEGKSLVARAIDAAIAATKLTKVVVSSDDEGILEIARRYRTDLALHRPAEISGDLSPAIEYVQHALNVLESGAAKGFDAVVIIQPSSPLTASSDIDAAVVMLEQSLEADSVVSVMEVGHAYHPLKFKVFEGNRLLPFMEEERGRMAAHELPKVYVRNCSVYATRRRVIESGQIIGEDCRGYIMPRERSIDINDELDFRFAEFLLSDGN